MFKRRMHNVQKINADSLTNKCAMFKTKKWKLRRLSGNPMHALYASMIDDEDNDSWSSLC